MQFGVQLLGFLVAGLTDALGPLGVLSLQGLFLAFGALCFGALRRRLPKVMTVVPADKPKESTVVRYLEMRFNIDVPESVFSLRNLQR